MSNNKEEAPPKSGPRPTNASVAESVDVRSDPLAETSPGITRPREAAPPSRRNKAPPREAGPSEKQVYVPPVTLPPNRVDFDRDMAKIKVADSALAPGLDERSRPTIRKLPAVQQQGLGPSPEEGENKSRTVGGRTARFNVNPEDLPSQEEQAAAPGVVNLPKRTQRLTGGSASAEGSPWAKDGSPQIDKENLPSAQLLATQTSERRKSPQESAKRQAEKRKQFRTGAVFSLIGIAAVLGLFAVFMMPRGSDDRPIDVAVTAEPTAATTAPAQSAAEVAPPPETTAPPVPAATTTELQASATPVETAPATPVSKPEVVVQNQQPESSLTTKPPKAPKTRPTADDPYAGPKATATSAPAVTTATTPTAAPTPTPSSTTSDPPPRPF